MKNTELSLNLPLQINAQSVMTDFCYGYSAALLNKLKELRAEGRIFEDNERADKLDVQYQATGDNVNENLTPIADSVACALENQIPGLKIETSSSRPSKVDAYITLVEEFLTIFELKPEYNRDPEDPTGD